MAAVTFTDQDQADRITVSATVGNVTQVTFHQNTRTVFIQGYDAAGIVPTAAKYALASSGLSDDDAIGANFMTIPAGAKVEIPLAGKDRVLGGGVLYIASSVISGIIEVEAESTPIS